MVKEPKKRKLRCGFTTGTAAAAAAKGALWALLEGKGPSGVDIQLLTGASLRIPIRQCHVTVGAQAECTVIKDAGDDPDITHNAVIGARVRLGPAETGPDRRIVDITGGEGVGRVTKPGLAVPPGEPAINPGPREMIRQAVMEVLKDHPVDKRVTVEIFVPEGETLAQKTLNPRLGILGGISILGTTGVVTPLSHAAYIATIRSALSVARAAGLDRVVLTTGRRSERFAQSLWPGLPPETFIQMGDYFKKAVTHAARQGFPVIVLAVFFGKAVKMAQGLPHTHAAKSRLSMETLSRWALETTGDPAFARTLASANTARHALTLIRETHPQVAETVGARLVAAARTFSGDSTRIHGIIFDYDASVLYDSRGKK